MVPLPKRRHSTRRQGKRKASISLRMPAVLTCPNCGSLRLPHRACEYCGWYNGKKMISVKSKQKKEKKKSE